MPLMLKSFLDNGGIADWMGDTFCDDINNNEKCNYDDGDCCGFSMNYNFCIDCTCKCKLNLIRLLNCTSFLKSLVYKIDFWTWFFVYFKLDFYCLFSVYYTVCIQISEKTIPPWLGLEPTKMRQDLKKSMKIKAWAHCQSRVRIDKL